VRYTYTLPSVAGPTSLYPSAPPRFDSAIAASEIDRSGRIFVLRGPRERIAVDGKIAIIALHDRLESRSPEPWNSLDLLTWAEAVREIPAPDVVLESACMEGSGSQGSC
jgi:hypothetical protein